MVDSACKFAVLGCGNGGMALAGQIASKGYQVNIWDGLEPTQDFKRLCREKEIFIKGHIDGYGKINLVTNNIAEAVTEAEVLAVVVPAFAHEPIFTKLIPHLKEGHRVVLIPGNYGSFLLKKMMVDAGVRKHISISETASLPYACRTTSYNSVMVHKQKLSLKLATSPQDDNAQIVGIMNLISDMYIPAGNILETSMDNFNSILHPLPVLLNFGAIERDPINFSHYMHGITPLISEKMALMDMERMQIGRELSLDLVTTLDQLKMYYGYNQSSSIYEYVNSDDSPYKNIIGHSVTTRYLTEDVPYLVVPAVLLAKKLEIATPIMEMCVNLSSMLHNTDYMKTGNSLERLGIAQLSQEEFTELIA